MDRAIALAKSFLKHPFVISIFATIVSLQIYSSSSFISQIDLFGRDLFFQLRHSLKKLPSGLNNIVLVTIDDASTQKLKSKWPLPRSIYATAVQKINAQHPRVIGFDFVFQGKDLEPGSDELFQQALSGAGNVVLASYLEHGGELISADPDIQKSAFRTALVNKMVDRDGVVRRAPILMKGSKDETNHLSWESQIFLKAIGMENSKVTERAKSVDFEIDNRSLSIPSRNSMVDINYTATYDDLVRVPFWKVYQDDVDPDAFRGKIVLTGLTALALHDFHPTPLKTMPGLVLNANVLLTLLERNFLTRIPLMFNWVVIFLSIFFILKITEGYSTFFSFTSVTLMCVVYLGFEFLLLWHNIIWDFSYVVLISILIFFFAVIYKQFQTAVENIRLREESVRDPLTGFYTRRFLEVHLRLDVKKVLSRSRSHGALNEVSIVMIDLDNFKLVNDSFGHQEGDRVLKVLGESIRSSVRKDELVCRYGGDEFCVILPGTSLQNAIQFAEKLRLLVSGNPDLSYTTKDGVKTFRVTGSFGVASVQGDKALSPENLLKAADRALYRAKKGGRNQVCSFDPERDIIDAK